MPHILMWYYHKFIAWRTLQLYVYNTLHHAHIQYNYYAVYSQVNANGIISFNDPFTSVIPSPFPLSSDAELIAPYWAHADITSAGTVFYRETNDTDVLTRASDDVRSFFINFPSFSATTVFISTWEEIGYNSGGVDRVRNFCILKVLYSIHYIQYTINTHTI